MSNVTLRSMSIDADTPVHDGRRHTHVSVTTRRLRNRAVRAECTCGVRADGTNIKGAKFALSLKPCTPP